MVVKNIMYWCLVYFVCLMMNCIMLQFDICDEKYELIILCIASIVISILMYYLFYYQKKEYTKRDVIKLSIGILLSQLSFLTAICVSFAITFNDF